MSGISISPSIIKACYKKKNDGQLSTSDKIDQIVTNRWLGLPIFAVIMFLVYYISMVTVGSLATDWANDGVFGDGWHLLGIGSQAYSTDADDVHRGDRGCQRIHGYVTYLAQKISTPTRHLPRLEGYISPQADTADG